MLQGVSPLTFNDGPQKREIDPTMVRPSNAVLIATWPFCFLGRQRREPQWGMVEIKISGIIHFPKNLSSLKEESEINL